MKQFILASALLLLPSFAWGAWYLSPTVARAGLTAVGVAGGSGAAAAPCAIAAVVAMLTTIMSSINHDRWWAHVWAFVGHRALPSQWHYLRPLQHGDLEAGVWHTIEAGTHTMYASRHLEGYNLLQHYMGDSGSNGLAKRTDGNDINHILALFGDRSWPVSTQWSDDDLNNMATFLLSKEDLTAEGICSTINDDTDAETFDVSWVFGTPNYPISTVPAPCPV